MNLGVMAIKEYSLFPEAPALLEPHLQIVWCHDPGHLLGEFYPSSEKQLVYSAASAEWTTLLCGEVREYMEYNEDSCFVAVVSIFCWVGSNYIVSSN